MFTQFSIAATTVSIVSTLVSLWTQGRCAEQPSLASWRHYTPQRHVTFRGDMMLRGVMTQGWDNIKM